MGPKTRTASGAKKKVPTPKSVVATPKITRKFEKKALYLSYIPVLIMMKRTILLSSQRSALPLTAAAAGPDRQDRRRENRSQSDRNHARSGALQAFFEPDGPTYVLPVAQIHYIQYANGEKEYYTKTIPATPLTPATRPPGHSWPPRLLPDSFRLPGCPGSAGRAACFRRPVRAQTVRNRRTLQPERHPGSDLPAFGRPPARTGRVAR